MHKYAFFDVDSLKLSPNGRTYVCHPNFSEISDDLYDIYNLSAAIFAPVVFTVDVNGEMPDSNANRKDFLMVPASKTEETWKTSVNDRYKFYMQRVANDDSEKNAVFTNNENAIECIKNINAPDWYVYGTGIKNNVEHVIENLLKIVKNVKFIPELIVPGENETEEELSSSFHKWEAMGAEAVNYKTVLQLVHFKKGKRF